MTTTTQVGESLSELVRYEGIEQRVKTTVDVEDERRNGRYVHLLVRVATRPPLLPLDAHVVRQHAQRERGHDSGQQTHDLASGRERIVVDGELS